MSREPPIDRCYQPNIDCSLHGRHLLDSPRARTEGREMLNRRSRPLPRTPFAGFTGRTRGCRVAARFGRPRQNGFNCVAERNHMESSQTGSPPIVSRSMACCLGSHHSVRRRGFQGDSLLFELLNVSFRVFVEFSGTAGTAKINPLPVVIPEGILADRPSHDRAVFLRISVLGSFEIQGPQTCDEKSDRQDTNRSFHVSHS